MKTASLLLAHRQQTAMISAPTYFLHVSFLLHGLAFALLVIGYSTPYWTVVSVSSGRVHYLGLVVSCWETQCQMLHVTDAREILVVVFGVSTANILLALFIAQLFCLSICNASFRLRNMGIGLSYLSFLLALSVGVTQILYQIDLKEEHKPDVATMKVGWSRHLVITSSLKFLLGAFFSIIDYNKRIRLQQRGFQRRCSNSNKIFGTGDVSRDIPEENYASDQDIAESANDACIQEKRMLKTVHIAQNMSAVKEGLKKSAKNHRGSSNTPVNNRGLIMVGEVGSGNMEQVAIHGQFQQGRGQHGTRQDREGIAIVADALKKYNLTKVRKSELIDGRHCLPTVEEEKVSAEASHQAQKKGALTRQVAVADDSDSYSDSSEKLCVTNNETQHDPTDKIQNNKLQPGISCDKKNEKKENISQKQNYRRSSTVEHVLLNVSQFLDKTVSGGNLIADYSFGTNNSKPSFQNNASRNAEKKQTCNPMGKWRKTVNQNSKRNDEGSCPSVDSRSSDHPGKSAPSFNDDNEPMYKPNMAEASGSEPTKRRGSKFHEKLSSEQIKRNMILQCLSRDLGKRRKQIRQ